MNWKKIIDNCIWFWDSFISFPLRMLGRIFISLAIIIFIATQYESGQMTKISVLQYSILQCIILFWGIIPVIDKIIIVYQNIRYKEQ